jgi:hypothetical protein
MRLRTALLVSVFATGSALALLAHHATSRSGAERIVSARERYHASLDPADGAALRDVLCRLELHTQRELHLARVAVWDERALFAWKYALGETGPRPASPAAMVAVTCELVPAGGSIQVTGTGYGRKLVRVDAQDAGGRSLVARPMWIYVHDGLGSAAHVLVFEDESVAAKLVEARHPWGLDEFESRGVDVVAGAQPPRSRADALLGEGDSVLTFLPPHAVDSASRRLVIRTARGHERVTITDLAGVEIVRGIADRFGELVVTGLPPGEFLAHSATWHGAATVTRGAIPGDHGGGFETWLVDSEAKPPAPGRADLLGFLADSSGTPIPYVQWIAQYYPAPGRFGHRTGTADRCGSFRLTDVPADVPLDLLPRDPTPRNGVQTVVAAGSRRIFAAPGRENVLRLVIPAGRIHVRIGDGVPVGSSLRVTRVGDREEEPVATRRVARDVREAVVVGLAPGTHRIRIETADGSVRLDERVEVRGPAVDGDEATLWRTEVER